MQQRTIAFIGCGNMAQAIIGGLLQQNYPIDKIFISDPKPQTLDYFNQLGAKTSLNNADIAKQAEVVLLAVKPQIITQVCEELTEVNFNEKLLISIAAGVSTTRLQTLLPSAKSILRAMPNTPALVSCGMTGLWASQNIPQHHRTFAQYLFNTIGDVVFLDNEQDMHAVTAASGSSPAYFFLMLETMQNALEKMNIQPDVARQLVQQAMLGASKMAIENPQPPLCQLRQNVTSKGGTTAAALNVFEQQDFSQIIEQAMQACVARSKQMETEF